MKFQFGIVAAVAVVHAPQMVSGFVSPSPSSNIKNTSAMMMTKKNVQSSVDDRRSFLQNGVSAVLGAVIVSPQIANAGLLDEFGSDPTKIVQETKAKESFQYAPKKESDLEPNLRSNYYYPTNKKRYLPRIKKCNDAIPDAAVMIGQEDWEGAGVFASKIADDTILPMKLYTSSLLGGGTNVKVSFAKNMDKAAADFEKAQKKLVKAISKKDQQTSTTALEELAEALLAYRTAGKLLGDDIGDIPSVDDIRRSASRTQKRFEYQ